MMGPIIGVIADAVGRKPPVSGGGGGTELDAAAPGESAIINFNEDGTQYAAPGTVGIVDDE